jgi:hypothetical protein
MKNYFFDYNERHLTVKELLEKREKINKLPRYERGLFYVVKGVEGVVFKTIVEGENGEVSFDKYIVYDENYVKNGQKIAFITGEKISNKYIGIKEKVLTKEESDEIKGCFDKFFELYKTKQLEFGDIDRSYIEEVKLITYAKDIASYEETRDLKDIWREVNQKEIEEINARLNKREEAIRTYLGKILVTIYNEIIMIDNVDEANKYRSMGLDSCIPFYLSGEKYSFSLNSAGDIVFYIESLPYNVANLLNNKEHTGLLLDTEYFDNMMDLYKNIKSFTNKFLKKNE